MPNKRISFIVRAHRRAGKINHSTAQPRHGLTILIHPFFLVLTGAVVGGFGLLVTTHNRGGAAILPPIGGAGGAVPQPLPKGIPIGIFRAHPALAISTRWEDNVYKTASDQRQDQITQLQPVIRLVTHWGKNQLDIAYGVTVERYGRLHGEDNTDQDFTLDLKLVPSAHTEFNLGYALLAGHDARGTPEVPTVDVTVGSNAATTPNTWLKHTLKGSTLLTFNRFKPVLSLEHSDQIYTNNNQSIQNHALNDGGLTLKWALTAKTELLAEMGYKNITYDESPLMDSVEKRVLAGLTWKATGQTEGLVKLGTVSKDFGNDPGKDSTALTWESGILWRPQQRTRINFTSTRQFQEGGEQAEHFVSTKFQVDLKHDLQRNWSLTSGLDFTNSAFEPERLEDYWNSSMGLEYRLHHWVTLSTQLTHKTKRSSVATAEYDSNGLMLSFVGTL